MINHIEIEIDLQGDLNWQAVAEIGNNVEIYRPVNIVIKMNSSTMNNIILAMHESLDGLDGSSNDQIT